jgi:hypothetical protein
MKTLGYLFPSAAPGLTIIGGISVNDPSPTSAAVPKRAKPVPTLLARKDRAAWWHPWWKFSQRYFSGLMPA